jgi:uncharacterized low-complexity protein
VSDKKIRGYSAKQNPDGTWDILGVPAYGANSRSFGKIPVMVNGKIEDQEIGVNHDADWLKKAIETAKLDYEERGYMAPLHIHHHGDSDKVERAGFFMPREVRRMVYGGKPLDILFVDLLKIPDRVYRLVKAGELPYRSVEVSRESDAEPEIKSLALLEHEPPYFKLPLLTIENESARVSSSVQDGALVAAYKAGGGVINFLYRAEDAEEEKGGDDKPAPDPAVEGKPGEAVKADDETKKIESKTMEGSLMDKILLLLTAMCQKMGVGIGDDKAAMGGGPAEQPTDKEQKEIAGGSPAPAGAFNAPVASFDPAEWAQMRAEITCLKEQIRAFSAEKDLDAKVDGAVADLKGRPVTEKMRAELRAAAALGEKALAMYVSTVKNYVPQDPPADPLAGQIAAAASGDAIPSEVLEYQGKGEKALALAVESWKAYKALGSRVGQTGLKAWLARNVAAGMGQSFLAIN